jgi:hypothetical protein
VPTHLPLSLTHECYARSLTLPSPHVPHGEAQKPSEPVHTGISPSRSSNRYRYLKGGCDVVAPSTNITSDTTHGNAQHMLINVALRYKVTRQPDCIAGSSPFPCVLPRVVTYHHENRVGGYIGVTAATELPIVKCILALKSLRGRCTCTTQGYQSRTHHSITACKTYISSGSLHISPQ